MKSGLKKIIFFMITMVFIFSITQGSVQAQTEREAPAKPVSQASIPPDSDKYVIGPEDVLQIQVWKEETLSQQVLVRNDGKISLPLIDEVQAAGLTPLKLKEVLILKFREFVEDPQITVMVREARSFKIYLLGQVTRPGVINLSGETSLLQVISMAGGFTEWANQKKILLIRREKGQESRMTINFKNIISGKDMKANIILKSGDTIIVPD
jgi:polysaccharide export outer membrane protein